MRGPAFTHLGAGLQVSVPKPGGLEHSQMDTSTTESEQVDLLTQELRKAHERQRKYLGMTLTALQIVGYLQHAYYQEHSESMLDTLPQELQEAYQRVLMGMANDQAQADVRDMLREGFREAEEHGEELEMSVEEMQEKMLDSTGVRAAMQHKEQLRNLRNSLLGNLPDGPLKEALRSKLGGIDPQDQEQEGMKA